MNQKRNNEVYKEDQLRSIWLEYGHEPDIDPQKTIVDLDISHQRGWREEK
jgi:hypothetical protein